jgi:hypothetical protein
MREEDDVLALSAAGPSLLGEQRGRTRGSAPGAGAPLILPSGGVLYAASERVWGSTPR